jgi:hypothetical protein
LGTQDDHKQYDWDGYFTGYGIKASIKPGWYVPFSMRRPATTIHLAKEIVGRLTSMLLGSQNQPAIQIDGDEDAEAYVRAIAKASRLFQKFVEARNLGGSCGGVVVSYGLVDAQPRIEVHSIKHCRVLAWKDRAEVIPEAVIKAYRFVDEVFQAETGRYEEKLFWYARYWDSRYEYVWERISDDEVKEDPLWFRHVHPDRGVEHQGGGCPVVWIQNVPCSSDPDGESDYDGELDNLDTLNRMQSATAKGTLANSEPTLVVRSSRKAQAVRKGTGTSIWSEGGADYLTLPGDAMQAAIAERNELRTSILSACQVVIPSAEKLSGAAQSAAAIRLLYAPMTARCDVLREQYGEMGIVRVLEGLLGACKSALARGETVDLPARMGADGDGRSEIPHVPGERESISLTWPPYFPPTWGEKNEAAQAVQKANGGKAIISQRTAVTATAQLWGVEDPDLELDAIRTEADEALERQAAELGMFAEEDDDEDEEEGEPSPPPKGPGPAD